MSVIQNIKYELQKHNILTVLLVLNVSLFIVINLDIHIFHFGLIGYLALPIGLDAFILRFWTLFTYMFSHADLGHVFYNMLIFYFSARTFLNLLSEKKLLYVYIMSGLSGGFILLILSALFPAVFGGSVLYGASAAVMGTVMCLAVYVPNLPITLFGLLEMRYKYYAALIFALYTIIDFSINTGGKISHFGGAFFGLFFGYMLKNGKDISEFSFFKKKKTNNLKVVHSNPSKTETIESVDQQTLDMLLDKILKKGYENLSKSEKELLFKLSQKK